MKLDRNVKYVICLVRRTKREWNVDRMSEEHLVKIVKDKIHKTEDHLDEFLDSNFLKKPIKRKTGKLKSSSSKEKEEDVK